MPSWPSRLISWGPGRQAQSHPPQRLHCACALPARAQSHNGSSFVRDNVHTTMAPRPQLPPSPSSAIFLLCTFLGTAFYESPTDVDQQRQSATTQIHAPSNARNIPSSKNRQLDSFKSVIRLHSVLQSGVQPARTPPLYHRTQTRTKTSVVGLPSLSTAVHQIGVPASAIEPIAHRSISGYNYSISIVWQFNGRRPPAALSPLGSQCYATMISA